MLARIWLTLILVMTSFVASTTNGLASRAEQCLRDRVYISPTWGFSVRWYNGEWTVDQETTTELVAHRQDGQRYRVRRPGRLWRGRSGLPQ
jgi:hypothetical protein